MLAISELERMVRGASLRVTRPRVAVLAAVHEHPHADTNSIIGRVREDPGEVSAQAVYDVLRALTDVGLVRRIVPRAPRRATSRGSGITITTSYAGRAVPSPTSIAPSVPHLA
jgi:Fe2+ or Zn2+ uptake regulation protein